VDSVLNRCHHVTHDYMYFKTGNEGLVSAVSVKVILTAGYRSHLAVVIRLRDRLDCQ